MSDSALLHWWMTCQDRTIHLNQSFLPTNANVLFCSFQGSRLATPQPEPHWQKNPEPFFLTSYDTPLIPPMNNCESAVLSTTCQAAKATHEHWWTQSDFRNVKKSHELRTALYPDCRRQERQHGPPKHWSSTILITKQSWTKKTTNVTGPSFRKIILNSETKSRTALFPTQLFSAGRLTHVHCSTARCHVSETILQQMVLFSPRASRASSAIRTVNKCMANIGCSRF